MACAVCAFVPGTAWYMRFKIPYQPSSLLSAVFTFVQGDDHIVLEKTETIFDSTEETDDNEIYLVLSQEETLKFMDEMDTLLQVNLMMNNGRRKTSIEVPLRIRRQYYRKTMDEDTEVENIRWATVNLKFRSEDVVDDTTDGTSVFIDDDAVDDSLTWSSQKIAEENAKQDEALERLSIQSEVDDEGNMVIQLTK